MNLKKLTPIELLQLQDTVKKELKQRNIIRTMNNPLGDYTEWLTANALGLKLENNSKAGYDGTDLEGLRYQIKGRRVTTTNNTRQLGAIRNYEHKDFDILTVLIFNEQFTVIEAVLIPHEIIAEYATYRPHVNAHILRLKGPILLNPKVTSFIDSVNQSF